MGILTQQPVGFSFTHDGKNVQSYRIDVQDKTDPTIWAPLVTGDVTSLNADLGRVELETESLAVGTHTVRGTVVGVLGGELSTNELDVPVTEMNPPGAVITLHFPAFSVTGEVVGP